MHTSLSVDLAFAHVKLPKIQQIIEHYGSEKIMEGNVVNLKDYRELMNLE